MVRVCYRTVGLRPPYCIGVVVSRLTFLQPLTSGPSSIKNFLRSYAGTMAHLDGLFDCNNHIRQFGTSPAYSVKCNVGVDCPDLRGRTCALAVAFYRPATLSILVCYPLLKDSTAMTFFRLCPMQGSDPLGTKTL